MKTYVFDLDGTIVENGKPIKNVIARKIEWVSNNNKIIFASARPVRDMLPLIPDYLQNCLMVGCNGGMVWQNKKFIFSNFFDPNFSDKIVTFLRKENIPYILDSDWSYSVSQKHHDFHAYIRTLSDDEVAEDTLLETGVSKILILDGASRKAVDDFLSMNGYKFNIHHHKSDNLFDITPQKENKYLALARLGLDFNKVVAFGNDANDFAMLDNAQTSVFIGSASDYPNADYYCTTDNIPSLLQQLQTK
ncbi:HAD-IIB family hydrolase [Brenneria izadpanahii]|uniref:HAD-IIB family hydrolase n=1 Tax=Brenneria izadpanahii TaxID=2722756 RepID=A0ABX7UWX3_9GAMM|nr:HAD-IIB family hydrolase [Brenneria izadpanahii]QTF10104.1 HAD-IIB family hydrolase [Brenneria izadpanahii]